MLEIGGEAMKILGRLIHHGEHEIEGDFSTGLSGAGNVDAGERSQEQHKEQQAESSQSNPWSGTCVVLAPFKS